MGAPRWPSVLLASLLGLALASSTARGQPPEISVHAVRSGEWLAGAIEALHLLDARTASTIESGLPGSCEYQLLLRDVGSQVVAARPLHFQLRLDLWSGEYHLEGPQGSWAFQSLAAADSAWSHVGPVPLMPLKDLRVDASYRLEVEVRVSPLGAEERDRMSRYVRQSSGEDRDEFAFDVGALLRRFLERGEDHGSGPRFLGPSFRLDELMEEP